MRAIAWAWMLLVLLLGSDVESANALDKPVGSSSVRDAQLTAAAAKLDGGDESSIRQGLTALTELGGDPAARAVAARLQRGLPPHLIEAAVDTLVLLNRPVSGAALLELTQHRRSQIRSKAIMALGALKQQSAQAALLYALDDPSPEVRGAAVDALGAVGNARAVPALIAAAERGAPGAWHAIGLLAAPGDVKLLLEHAPEGDVVPIRAALDALIARADWSMAARTRLLQQLSSLGTPSVRACLSDYRASAALAAPRLQQAITDALARLEREHAPEKMLANGTHPAAAPQPLAAALRPSVDPKAPKDRPLPPPAALRIDPPKARSANAPSAASVAKVEP